ncbi:MAG TPA: hypothetical protein VGO62_21475, partial [Myxococcota bacterium]
MSNVDRAHRTEPRPPPPPPKPKPHHETKKAEAHVSPKKATAEVQHAARARFAHHAAPTRAEVKHKSDEAARAINQAAVKIGTSRDDASKRASTLKAAHTLAQQLQGATPSERAQILSKTGPAVSAIGAGLDKLDRDQTQKAVGDLASATEAAGPHLARQITDTVALALPHELAGNHENQSELSDGISNAVKSGKGALFATSLAQSARAVPPLVDSGAAKDLDGTAQKAIGDAQKTFDDANKKAALLDGRLAVAVDQWKKSGALTPGAIDAGVKAFKAAHKDDYAAADNAARTLATTLPGAGLAAREPGALGDASRAALKDLPQIASRDAGANVIAGALEHQAPYLDESKRLLGEGPNAKANLAGFDNAILRSVAVGGPDLVKHGERDRVANLVAGAAHAVSDKKLAQSLQEYHDKI